MKKKMYSSAQNNNRAGATVLLGDLASRKIDIRLPGKKIQTLMAQGQSTKIISSIQWIRNSRLSVKNSLSSVLLGDLASASRRGHFGY